MKYFILIVIIFFTSCVFYTGQEDWDYYTPCDFKPMTLSDIAAFCRNQIVYTTDLDQYGRIEYWATPAEILASRKGDCEDIAGLFAYLAYNKLDIVPIFIVLQSTTTNELHMAIETPNYIIKYWLGNPSNNWKQIQTYTYGEFMWICQNTHASYAGGRSID